MWEFRDLMYVRIFKANFPLPQKYVVITYLNFSEYLMFYFTLESVGWVFAGSRWTQKHMRETSRVTYTLTAALMILFNRWDNLH